MNRREKLARVFNEWNRRYAENPEDFTDSVDSEGKPLADYGEECAHYFEKIEAELSNRAWAELADQAWAEAGITVEATRDS